MLICLDSGIIIIINCTFQRSWKQYSNKNAESRIEQIRYYFDQFVILNRRLFSKLLPFIITTVHLFRNYFHLEHFLNVLFTKNSITNIKYFIRGGRIATVHTILI